MKILGIESSCDETSAAVVEDGKRLLSVVTASSMDLHAQYGGVIPEIAARSHIEAITPVIKDALAQADCAWVDIDAIAVTYGAGLGGSLLVGVLTARTLAITHNKPLYAINHVEAHVYANFLTELGPRMEDRRLKTERTPQSSVPSPQSSVLSPQSNWVLPKKQPQFPLLALIVSGGHSQLVLFRDHFDYTLLGQTHDDAIGEAFDKVAKVLGLPYPGGPSVGKKALDGNPFAFDFPKARLTNVSPELVRLRKEMEDWRLETREAPLAQGSSPQSSILSPQSKNHSYDFSFSGPKTAVLRAAQNEIGEDHSFPSFKLSERLSEAQKADIAASFQRVAVETVVDKTVLAYEEFQPKSVVIAGGVAASPELRRQLSERLPLPIAYTDPKLCTDNGAMVATLGCYHLMHNLPVADPYSLSIKPNLSM